MEKREKQSESPLPFQTFNVGMYIEKRDKRHIISDGGFLFAFEGITDKERKREEDTN
jgi:hypothetical protein